MYQAFYTEKKQSLPREAVLMDNTFYGPAQHQVECSHLARMIFVQTSITEARKHFQLAFQPKQKHDVSGLVSFFSNVYQCITQTFFSKQQK